MTSGTFTAAYLELHPQLERISKGKVVTVTTSMGVGSESIPSRLERGEAADIVIVADDTLHDLIKAAEFWRTAGLSLRARVSVWRYERARPSRTSALWKP